MNPHARQVSSRAEGVVVSLKRNCTSISQGVTRSAVAAGVAASLVHVTGALAQDPSRTLPRPVDTGLAPPTTLPVAPPIKPLPGDAGVLIANLKGLAVVPERIAAQLTSNPGVSVTVEFLMGREGLQQRLAERIGKPLTSNELNQICQEIVAECREAGRPVVDVKIPEQDITDGYVRVSVLEGTLGKVRVEGERRSVVAERLAGQVRLRPGGSIDSNTLIDDVDWINRRSPFRRVEPVFEKGSKPGEADVVLKSSSAKYPLRIYGSFENTGSDSTGNDRFIAGFNWGDAFGLGLDHQLGYQYTTDDEGRRFHAHGVTYTAPLPWRHIVGLSGTWSRSEPDFDDPAFFSVGESWQISGKYEIPLRRKSTHSGELRSSVELGFDVKRSNNDLEFGGQQVFDRAADTIQFKLDYTFELNAETRRTNGRFGLVVSPGYLASDNNELAYDEARPGAEPTYAYLTADLSQQIELPKSFRINARVSGQVSAGALLSSEQFGIGGVDTVRGYDERAMNADNGIFGSIELQGPSLQVAPLLGMKSVEDDLRIFVFLDAGAGWNYFSTENDPSSVRGLSVGPGARYSISPFGSIDASYGFPLSTRGTEDDNGRGHFRISASFTW
jgi:hemolysin activation/secretion protein